MNSHEFEFLSTATKERQTEIEYALAQDLLLRNPAQALKARRRWLLVLALAAIFVMAVLASGAYLLV